MHSTSRSAILATTLCLGLTAAASAWVRLPQSSPQGDAPPSGDDQSSAHSRADFPIALVGDAYSLETQGTETVVTILNDGAATRTFRVEWLYDLGGPDTLAGTSGPLTLAPGQSLQFTTANSTETCWPFFNNAPRDTTTDFVGRAIVYSDQDGFRGLGIEAFELSGLDQGFAGAEALSPLPVFRKKADGGRQAGD